MAYRKVAQEVLATLAPSSYNSLATVFPALGVYRVLVLAYGSSGGSATKVAGILMKGSIDGVNRPDEGSRTVTVGAITPTTPVGKTRGNAVALVWPYPAQGQAYPPPGGPWPWPSMAIDVYADATAGTPTNVNVEVWVDDGTLSGAGQGSI
jgi:hypothetical protein